MRLSLIWMVLATTVVVSRSSHAELLWWGDPSKGTMVFKNFGGDGNCGNGTITTIADPTHGMIFRYDKPDGSNRCENHGVSVDGVPFVFQNGATYYLGWWSKLSSTANNNANFQWKSYLNHTQNFPIVLKMIGGQMTLMYTPPDGGSSFLWRETILADTWHHYVLGIKTSDDIRGGTIEFWFDGKKKMLSGSDAYASRTWDSKNCPKWGVYGGSGTAMTNFVADLRIATTYAEVAMGSPRPVPDPAGTPTDAGTSGLADAGTNSADAAADPGGPEADGSVGIGGGNDPTRGDGGSGGTPPVVVEKGDAGQTRSSPSRATGGCQLSANRRDEPGSSWTTLGLLAFALLARYFKRTAAS